MEINGKIKLLRSELVDSKGVAIKPLATELDYGQIALNYSVTDPCIFFKDSGGKIIKIVSEDVIADTLADILGGSATELSTLKELLDAFAASDLATTQVDILKRLTSLESGKVDKVSGKGLSTNDYTTAEKNKLAGIAAGAQVNTVTSVAGKTGVVVLTSGDVGLSAVLNKEQLGKTETAADSAKLGDRLAADYWHKNNNLINYPTDSVIDNTDPTRWGTVMLTSGAGVPSNLNYSQVYQLGSSYGGAGLQFAQTYGVGESQLQFRSRSDAPNAHWNSWFNIYHTGNSNKTTTDWTCKDLNVENNIVSKNFIEIDKTGASHYTRITNGGVIFMQVDNTINSYYGVDRGTKTPIWFNGASNIIWHAGNSNKSDVDWTARIIKATWVAAHSAADNSNGNNIIIEGSDGKGENKLGGGVRINAGKGTGINNSGSISFATGNGGSSGSGVNGITDRMVILHNGYVGINNPNPTERLDVNGNVKSNANISSKTATIGDNANANVSFGGGEGADNTFCGWVNHKWYDNIWQVGVKRTGSYGDRGYFIDRNGTNQFAILSNGNIGIDNPNPSEKLDVNGVVKSHSLKIGTGTSGGELAIIPDNSRYSSTGMFWQLKDFGEGAFCGLMSRNKDTPERILIGFAGDNNISPWSSNLGISILPNGSVSLGAKTARSKLDVYGYDSAIIVGTTKASGTGKSNKLRLGLATTEHSGSQYWCFSVDDNVSVVGDSLLRIGYDMDNTAISINAGKKVGINKLNPIEALDVNGNGLFNGNVTAKGDVVAFSSTNNVRMEASAVSATSLFDLTDVELPTTLTNNYVLAYDGTKKKWTAKESVGTGGSSVDYARLSNVPATFMPCTHSHNDIVYTSDLRLKTHITDIPNASLIINSMFPKQFGWNEKANSYGLTDEVSYGLIAQEVQEILPELVKPLGKEDYIGVDYIKIIPIIIAAFKEQREEIINLNKRILSYERRQNKSYTVNHDNETRISTLEKEIKKLSI